MSLGMQTGLGLGDTVLDGDRPTQHPSPKGHSPQFSARRVCCGQTAGWVKMPLGMEVGLAPGDIVLEWDPSPPERGTANPPFSPYVYYGQTVAHLSYC